MAAEKGHERPASMNRSPANVLRLVRRKSGDLGAVHGLVGGPAEALMS